MWVITSESEVRRTAFLEKEQYVPVLRGTRVHRGSEDGQKLTLLVQEGSDDHENTIWLWKSFCLVWFFESGLHLVDLAVLELTL